MQSIVNTYAGSAYVPPLGLYIVAGAKSPLLTLRGFWDNLWEMPKKKPGLQPRLLAIRIAQQAPRISGEVRSDFTENHAQVKALAASLKETEMHTSCRFVKSRVDLSASRYVNCVFDECVLLVSRKPVHVEGCTFIRPSIEFVGEAENTMALLGYFCANAPDIAEATAELLGLHNKTKH